MNPTDIITVHWTFKVEAQYLPQMEEGLSAIATRVISTSILPDTDELYLNDKRYKKFADNVKKAQDELRNYRNTLDK